MDFSWRGILYILRNDIDLSDIIALLYGVSLVLLFLFFLKSGNKYKFTPWLLLAFTIINTALSLYSLIHGFHMGIIGIRMGMSLAIIQIILGAWVGLLAICLLKDTEEVEIICNASGKPIVSPKINEDISLRAQSSFLKKIAEFNSKEHIADETTEAKLFSQSVELLLLKAPASAMFSPLEEMSVSLLEGVYTVNGWVDSQNSYGAMIRTPFKIQVVKVDGVWKTVSKFVRTSTTVGVSLAGRYIIGLVIAILMTAIGYFVIKVMMGI